MWCVAWWHSGREDEDEDEDDEDVCGPESSRTVPGYDDTLTPVSLETPVPSVMSRCDSFGVIQSSSPMRTPSAATIAGKSMSNDSVSPCS